MIHFTYAATPISRMRQRATSDHGGDAQGIDPEENTPDPGHGTYWVVWQCLEGAELRVAQALLPAETYLDEAEAVEFVFVRDCIRAEVKEKEVRVAGRQRSAHKFARTIATCTPIAVAVGAIFGMAVFAYAVSCEKTQDHPVAVC
jgi:hypothetical protein